MLGREPVELDLQRLHLVRAEEVPMPQTRSWVLGEQFAGVRENKG